MEERNEVVESKLHDANDNPRFGAEMTPEEAEIAGAFKENALSAEDAIEAGIDGEEADEIIKDRYTFAEDLKLAELADSCNSLNEFHQKLGELSKKG